MVNLINSVMLVPLVVQTHSQTDRAREWEKESERKESANILHMRDARVSHIIQTARSHSLHRCSELVDAGVRITSKIDGMCACRPHNVARPVSWLPELW